MTQSSTAGLLRIRQGVRATLGLGLAVSLVANVLHAQPNPISQAISAWPPLALMLTVELISRIPGTSRLLSTARLAAAAGLAGIAAWSSYWHMAAVAASYGEDGHAAQYLWPLTVDGLVIVASICLVEIGGRLTSEESMATLVATQVATAALATDDPDSDAEWRDPWGLSIPAQNARRHDVATEMATWMASSGGQREAEVARTAVATGARRPAASYDQHEARATIRHLMDQIHPELSGRDLDKAKASVDAVVANKYGVSSRTARRLRGQVAGEPVSGPPDTEVEPGR